MADPISLGGMAVGVMGGGSAGAAGMGMMGMASSAASGILGMFGAKNNADAQKLNIQGQLQQAMGQAMGMDIQAKQYKYQSNISQYQAGVAEINAKISKQNAAYARDVGEVEAQKVGMAHHAELSKMTAAQGASGLDVNVGSSVKVRESMIELGEHDEAVTRASAAKTAYGYEVEATMNEAQAEVYRYTASMQEEQSADMTKMADYTRTSAKSLADKATSIADKGGTLGMLGSLVSGAGSVAGKWMDYQKVFA